MQAVALPGPYDFLFSGRQYFAVPGKFPSHFFRESVDLTAIFFKEQQLDNHTAGFTAAPSSYINYNSTSALASGGPNAIEDLCFYITMYHHPTAVS